MAQAHVPGFSCPRCGTAFELRINTQPTTQAKQATSVPTGDVGDLLALAESFNLNDWERGFVTDMRERFDKYGDRIKVSDKQMATLRKIAAGDEEPPE